MSEHFSSVLRHQSQMELFVIVLTPGPPVLALILKHQASGMILLLQRSTAVQVRSSVRLMPQNQPSGRGLLLLQRSTAVQVKSSVLLMPQNQPSGRGLMPSPTASSPDQHPAAMLTDVSWRILGRTEGRGLGFGQLVRTQTGKCPKCQSSSDGHSDHSNLCAGRKIVVCWARSGLQIGSRYAWCPPFSFFQSPLKREWRSVLWYQ